MGGMTTLHEARTALSAVAARTADLIGASPDTAAAIPGSPWTVRKAAVHPAVIGVRYAGMVHGEPIQYPPLAPEDCARRDDELNADIAERRPSELAALVRDGTKRLLAATASCEDARDVLFDGGVVLSIRHLVGIAVAEHLLHGYDMAVATRRPWRIDPDHAVQGFLACRARDGRCLDPLTGDGHAASYVVELTTGQRYAVGLADGEHRIDEPGSLTVGCTVTADPVALLLVGAHRLSRWTGIALGLFRADGTRPELMLSLDDLFRFPGVCGPHPTQEVVR
jgi:hypothetical protein